MIADVALLSPLEAIQTACTSVVKLEVANTKEDKIIIINAYSKKKKLSLEFHTIKQFNTTKVKVCK